MSKKQNTAIKDPLPLLEDGTPDVAALMKNIRDEIKKTNDSFEISIPRYVSQREKELLADGASPLQSEELKYLNHHWNDWRQEYGITSHRPGVIGKIIVKVKTKATDFIWNNMLKEYFNRETLFVNNLLRFLNRTSRYIDAKDSESFLRVVDKVDRDVQGINERTDLLVEQLLSEIRSLRQENQDLRNLFEEHIEKKTLKKRSS